jgi:hypothetical protein
LEIASGSKLAECNLGFLFIVFTVHPSPICIMLYIIFVVLQISCSVMHSTFSMSIPTIYKIYFNKL